MQKIKIQSLNLRIISIPIHGAPNILEIVFVKDLVALKIKRPVTVAVELRDHLLLPVDIASVLHLLVPRCLNYTDLRVTDRSDTLERVIATDPNGDYVLINNRQERPYALLERIAVRYRIAQEGEPGDYHRHRKTDLWAKTVVSSTTFL